MAEISNSAKTGERFLAKVAARHAADPTWDADIAAAAIADLHRYAFAWPDHTYLDGVIDAVETMRQQGHQLLKWRNLWTDPAFAGISSLWLTTIPGYDHPIEVEFHTDASWHVRDGAGYHLYQDYTDRRSGPEQRDEIESRLRRLRTQTPTPDHAEWLTFEPSSPARTTPVLLCGDGYRYFAAADGDRYSRDSPFAVIRRRTGTRGGRNDEAYTRGYDWRTESFLLEAEHGDCQFDFHPIDQPEAERLVARLGDRSSDVPTPEGTPRA